MHPSQRRRRTRRILAGCTAAAVAAGLASAPVATAEEDGRSAQPTAYEAGRYVVLLEEDSATRYEGGTQGLEKTKQPRGFDEDRADVRAYQAHLRREQRKVAGSVGAQIQRDFTLASNGFTAQLSAEQATRLATDKRVALITEDDAFSVDTWNTPDFLGLSGSGGVWEQTGGPADAGAGVVVGILDTGIWPESPSFAGARLGSSPVGPWGIHRDRQTTRMTKADGGTFTGACETGEQWSLSHCTDKIVGARAYPEAFTASVPPKNRASTEYLSPRDGSGHGTHTAGTAAGNHGVPATVGGRAFGAVSGVAPAAKIAAYKVCFEDTDPTTGGCYTSATLDALDDAVADGVDVVNYSISGAVDTVVDAVEIAFLGAAEAGIFVAASAGNSGPGAATVAHNSPWITTVAASTHARFENTVVLGDGTKVKGASIASKDELPGSTRLVYSADVAAAGADPEQARLCYPGTLDAAKVTGAMVLCDRGAIARVSKSEAVARAGGVAAILGNVGGGSLDADFHSVPTVHVDSAGRDTVRAYLARTTTPTARFEPGDTTGGASTPVPQTAGFSSRGPALANEGDVIKPDITAPGVSVLAAVAPPTNAGRDFDLYSGTSMSSPHVAGLAAFILGERPAWSAMTVKSAMMTTAYDVKDGSGARATDPFAQGAGHVDPRRFLDPGLVVTADSAQFRGFLVDQGYHPDAWGPVEPVAATDLNAPSIADGALTGTTTTRRRFTALRDGTWTVAVSVPGFEVSHPRSVTVSAGQTAEVDLTFTRTKQAPLDRYATGFVTLTESTGKGRGGSRKAAAGGTVRLPVALRPVAVDAPATVRGTGAAGSVPVTVTGGYDGDLRVSTSGLARADTVQGQLPAGEYTMRRYTVPPGTSVARFDLDAADDRSDMDLYLYTADASGQPDRFVEMSASGSADESVTVTAPQPGDYVVVIDAYAPAPGGSTVPYRFDGFIVDPAAALGAFRAEPSTLRVTSGGQSTYQATWTGLAAGRYLGHADYAGSQARTMVYVDVAGPTG